MLDDSGLLSARVVGHMDVDHSRVHQLESVQIAFKNIDRLR